MALTAAGNNTFFSSFSLLLPSQFHLCKSYFQRVLRVADNQELLENDKMFKFIKHASTETSVIFSLKEVLANYEGDGNNSVNKQKI